MSVYDYVKALADEKSLTIKDVETAAGISNGSIKKWTESSPKVELLYRVSQVLGERIEYFLTGVRSEISDEERIILNSYRSTDTEGRFRIAQVAMNEMDKSQSHKVYRAANSTDNAEHTVEQRTNTNMSKFKNAPKVNSEEDL